MWLPVRVSVQCCRAKQAGIPFLFRYVSRHLLGLTASQGLLRLTPYCAGFLFAGDDMHCASRGIRSIILPQTILLADYIINGINTPQLMRATSIITVDHSK